MCQRHQYIGGGAKNPVQGNWGGANFSAQDPREGAETQFREGGQINVPPYEVGKGEFPGEVLSVQPCFGRKSNSPCDSDLTPLKRALREGQGASNIICVEKVLRA